MIDWIKETWARLFPPIAPSVAEARASLRKRCNCGVYTEAGQAEERERFLKMTFGEITVDDDCHKESCEA